MSKYASVPRFKRLEKAFNNPLSKLFLMFYSDVLPTFTHFNQFLQQDDPCIHLLKDQREWFLQKLFGRFVKVSIIKAVEKVPDVDFSDKDYQLDDSNLAAGYIVKQKLKNMVDEGDIFPDDVHKF